MSRKSIFAQKSLCFKSEEICIVAPHPNFTWNDDYVLTTRDLPEFINIFYNDTTYSTGQAISLVAQPTFRSINITTLLAKKSIGFITSGTGSVEYEEPRTITCDIDYNISFTTSPPARDIVFSLWINGIELARSATQAGTFDGRMSCASTSFIAELTTDDSLEIKAASLSGNVTITIYIFSINCVQIMTIQ